MWLLLPPSETKRDGGAEGSALDVAGLSFAELASSRRTVLAATRSLASNRTTMAAALGLGPTQLFEVERNRRLRQSPVLPALERYTGVLYDALDAPSLSDAARKFAAETVIIHSALFGLLAAADPIPAYRLSHDSKLPGLPLRTAWRSQIAASLASLDGLIIDMRSEAYVALGPAPEGAWFLRLVSEDEKGRRRALNHFNKKGKGEFARAILNAGIDFASVEELLAWAPTAGFRLSAAEGELTLVVAQG